jgi:hypothetical protein
VREWVFGGTWEASDVVNVTVGNRITSIAAGATSITTVVDNLVTALNASTLPEIGEITWDRNGNNLRGTADVAGIPFEVSLATTEAGGGAADAQTIDGGTTSAGSDTTYCTGPNHADNPQNWSGGTLPANGDTIIFASSNVSCLYALDFLTALTGTTILRYMSFTGECGLPPYNANGYYEYRPRYFEIEGGSARLGLGDGSGSSRFMLDFGSTAATVLVYDTGQSGAGEEVADFLKVASTSTVTVNKGRVGIAVYPGEASALSTLNIGFRDNPAGDSYVICGAGVTTLTTINQSGGFCRTETNSTTLTMTDGEHVRQGTCTLTTLNLDGGAMRYNSSGTLTTANVGSGGNLDFRQDSRAKTVTNTNLYEGFEYHDPIGNVTNTSGFDFVRCAPRDGLWDVAPHFTYTRSVIT